MTNLYPINIFYGDQWIGGAEDRPAAITALKTLRDEYPHPQLLRASRIVKRVIGRKLQEQEIVLAFIRADRTLGTMQGNM